MEVVLFRHGRAVSKEEAGSDEERWLTEEGRREVEAVARLLPWRPVVVYSSPLRRARETAGILASIHGSRVEVTEMLRPGAASCESLAGLASDKVVLVGHNPDLEMLVRCLTGGTVKLKAGGYALLSGEWRAGGMALVELVQPATALRLQGAR